MFTQYHYYKKKAQAIVLEWFTHGTPPNDPVISEPETIENKKIKAITIDYFKKHTRFPPASTIKTSTTKTKIGTSIIIETERLTHTITINRLVFKSLIKRFKKHKNCQKNYIFLQV